jgi:hypothetical protein
VLARTVSSCQNGFLGLSHLSVARNYLTHTENRLAGHHARELLLRALSPLVRTLNAHLTSRSSLVSPEWYRLVQTGWESMRVACIQPVHPSLHIALNPSALLLPLPADSCPPSDSEDEDEKEARDDGRWAVGRYQGLSHADNVSLVSVLTRHQPDMCAELLGKAAKIFRESTCVVNITDDQSASAGANGPSPNSPNRSGSSRSGSPSLAGSRGNNGGGEGEEVMVWSQKIQVDHVMSLSVSFERSCQFPAGCTLVFYATAQCTSVVRSFQGSTSLNPDQLKPFSVPSNVVWIKCFRQTSQLAEKLDLHFTVSPISDLLPLAVTVAHHTLNDIAKMPAAPSTSSADSNLRDTQEAKEADTEAEARRVEDMEGVVAQVVILPFVHSNSICFEACLTNSSPRSCSLMCCCYWLWLCADEADLRYVHRRAVLPPSAHRGALAGNPPY